MSTLKLLSLCILITAHGHADIFVSPHGDNTPPHSDWDTAAHDLLVAANLAMPGSTVWVEGGTTYVLTNTITLTKAVSISGYGSDQPVINGNASVRPFFVNHSDAVLDNLVVSNGFHTTNAGGVYLAAGTVRNCEIVGNTAPASGGMMINGNAVATNCVIRLNTATTGLFGGVGLLHAGARLLNSTIEANQSLGERGAGGGIITGAGIIDGCTFTNNATANNKSGGGLAILVDGAQVLNSRFYHNEGREGGGLIMTANGVVSNCYFLGNVATLEGGAARLDKGMIVNSEMRNNHAGNSGGGGVMNRSSHGATLRNCLIAGNTANNYAGGVIAIASGGLILENCTIVDNNHYGVYEWVDLAIAKTNCIVFFNTNNWHRNTQWQTSCTTPAVPGVQNQTNNPLFEDREKGNYTLSRKSPCIDVGITLDWMRDASDLRGAPRLAHGTFGGSGTPRVDLGAYEYSPPPPSGTVIAIH